MNTIMGVGFTILAAMLLTVSAVAIVLAPPFSLDSRDAFVLALAAAGLVLAAMAARRFAAARGGDVCGA